MAQPTYEWRPPAEGWPDDELRKVLDNARKYEMVDGAVIVSPAADQWHHWVADEIRAALRAAAPTGWRAIREIGLDIPDGYLEPDLTVLRPGAPMDTVNAVPHDVALVVEVESTWSRRHDRFTKPSIYADLGIESYWRIERTGDGPMAHLYTRNADALYVLEHSVSPRESVTVELPYPVEVAPATWMP